MFGTMHGFSHTIFTSSSTAQELFNQASKLLLQCSDRKLADSQADQVSLLTSDGRCDGGSNAMQACRSSTCPSYETCVQNVVMAMRVGHATGVRF